MSGVVVVFTAMWNTQNNFWKKQMSENQINQEMWIKNDKNKHSRRRSWYN